MRFGVIGARILGTSFKMGVEAGVRGYRQTVALRLNDGYIRR
jgi:hypothetical protein